MSAARKARRKLSVWVIHPLRCSVGVAYPDGLHHLFMLPDRFLDSVGIDVGGTPRERIPETVDKPFKEPRVRGFVESPVPIGVGAAALIARVLLAREDGLLAL